MNQGRAICTIIAKNYLSAARTLCQSYLALHPEDACFVLVVDDFRGFINPSDECFEVVALEDLEIPNLPSFCFKYNITELCTATKAFLMDYLIHQRAIKKLLYIDPDILITNSLEQLYGHLDAYDIALTPHLDTDYPDDNLFPDEGTILSHGLFNLGFIGINDSENAKSFLSWWKPKLYKRCIEDILNGYFVDQKFIDLVPLFFDKVFIEKGVGYNVAYWNLHSRRISKGNGIWKCNDGPLYFFHFSGYQLENPTAIGRTPAHARYRLSERPDLQPIFSEYQARVTTNGYEQSKNWPYSYAYFKTSQTIPRQLRIEYRNSENMEQYGNPFESPELMQRALMIEQQNQSITPDQNIASDQDEFRGPQAIPYKLILTLYKYAPGLRYLYRRWKRRSGN